MMDFHKVIDGFSIIHKLNQIRGRYRQKKRTEYVSGVMDTCREIESYVETMAPVDDRPSVTRCRECEHGEPADVSETQYYCTRKRGYKPAEGFCDEGIEKGCATNE